MPTQKRLFHFRAHYLTKGGNMGSATYRIPADDFEEAHEIGIARVRQRKSYAGKLDASTSEIRESHNAQ